MLIIAMIKQILNSCFGITEPQVIGLIAVGLVIFYAKVLGVSTDGKIRLSGNLRGL
jgi:hypothetical protein